MVMTANDISDIVAQHPALLRRGRLDAVWFLDIPTRTERLSIAGSVLRQHDLPTDRFDLDAIAVDGGLVLSVSNLAPIDE